MEVAEHLDLEPGQNSDLDTQASVAQESPIGVQVLVRPEGSSRAVVRQRERTVYDSRQGNGQENQGRRRLHLGGAMCNARGVVCRAGDLARHMGGIVARRAGGLTGNGVGIIQRVGIHIRGPIGRTLAAGRNCTILLFTAALALLRMPFRMVFAYHNLRMALTQRLSYGGAPIWGRGRWRDNLWKHLAWVSAVVLLFSVVRHEEQEQAARVRATQPPGARAQRELPAGVHAQVIRLETEGNADGPFLLRVIYCLERVLPRR